VFLKILKNKKLASVILVIVVFLLSLVFSFLLKEQFQTLNSKLSDTLYSRNEAREDIVIIGIDEKSVDLLGRFSTWKRGYYASLLEQLSDSSPKIIIFDIFFKNSDLNDADLSFSEKIKEIGNVILVSLLVDQTEQLPHHIFAESSKTGFSIATPDSDGIHRRTPLIKKNKEKVHLNSLAYEAYLKLGGSETDIPFDKDGQILINYFAEPFGYKIISFVDVLKGNVPKEEFDGKIVFVGLTSFFEVQDYALTPKSNKVYMSGVEVHANILQTLLDEKYLKEQNKISQYLEILLLSILSVLLINFTKLRFSIVVGLLMIPFFILILKISYQNGLLLKTIEPLLTLTLSYILAFAYRYFISDKQGRELKSAFSKYVSEELVEKISKNPDLVKLGGEKRIVTVFFMDIKDSTSYSEKIEITKWVKQLNEYFTVMESIIKARGGTLDKFEGDAIMGFFGAPFEQKDQVIRAFLSALDMKEALEKLHEKWSKEGLPLIEFRMGINTGEAIVGNIGSINRFDYTVMGDTVNTASRMEGSVNKTYNTKIISANFEKYCDINQLNQFILLREIDCAVLLGKSEATRLYEVYSKTNNLTDSARNIINTYSEGLKEYRLKNFEKAKNLFDSIAQFDPPAKAMSERIFKKLNGELIDELDENMNFKMNKK
jgi:adenylate cyclase